MPPEVIFGVKKAQEHENLEIWERRKFFVTAGKWPFYNFFWLWQFFQVKMYLRWRRIMNLDQLDPKKGPYGHQNEPKMAKFAIPAFRASWRPRGVQSWKKKLATLQFIIYPNLFCPKTRVLNASSGKSNWYYPLTPLPGTVTQGLRGPKYPADLCRQQIFWTSDSLRESDSRTARIQELSRA